MICVCVLHSDGGVATEWRSPELERNSRTLLCYRRRFYYTQNERSPDWVYQMNLVRTCNFLLSRLIRHLATIILDEYPP